MIAVENIDGLGHLNFQVVERKGSGHPDTLVDELAAKMNAAYARYCLEKFDIIPTHDNDKLHLVGGRVDVGFGSGTLVAPVQLFLNGRVTSAFAGEEIPVHELYQQAIADHMRLVFNGLIDPVTDLALNWHLRKDSSPGRLRETTGYRARMFEPLRREDVRGYDGLLRCNDTSMGSGFAPFNALELAVIAVETELNSPEFKATHLYLGTDIKIMARRFGATCHVTACLPQIARYVPNVAAYRQNLKEVAYYIQNRFEELLPDHKIVFRYNTRDDYDNLSLYLTVTGSAIDSGDCGAIGRGNRFCGFISPQRPINLEGMCGKNEVYHVGLLYNVAAQCAAEALYHTTGHYAEVTLVGESGQPLLEPATILVRTACQDLTSQIAEEIVMRVVEKIPQITQDLVYNRIKLV